MIIYNKNTSKNQLSQSSYSNKILKNKLNLKSSLKHINLTESNKEFLKSLNLKLKKP